MDTSRSDYNQYRVTKILFGGIAIVFGLITLEGIVQGDFSTAQATITGMAATGSIVSYKAQQHYSEKIK